MWRLLMQLLPLLMNSSLGDGNNAGPFGGGNPFGGGQQQSSGPIDVDAHVVGEDDEQRAREAQRVWQSTTNANHSLQGSTAFAGSRSYSIGILIASFVALLGGVAWRIFALVQGNIFSSVVVPAAIGAIFTLLISLIGLVLIWRKGKDRIPVLAIDFVFLFFSSAAMGYANLLCFALTLAVCWLYQRKKGIGKIPFIIPYLFFAVLIALLLGYPGLMSGILF